MDANVITNPLKYNQVIGLEFSVIEDTKPGYRVGLKCWKRLMKLGKKTMKMYVWIWIKQERITKSGEVSMVARDCKCQNKCRFCTAFISEHTGSCHNKNNTRTISVKLISTK